MDEKKEPEQPTNCYPMCQHKRIVKEVDYGYAIFRVWPCDKCGLYKHDWTPVWGVQKG